MTKAFDSVTLNIAMVGRARAKNSKTRAQSRVKLDKISRFLHHKLVRICTTASTAQETSLYLNAAQMTNALEGPLY